MKQNVLLPVISIYLLFCFPGFALEIDILQNDLIIENSSIVEYSVSITGLDTGEYASYNWYVNDALIQSGTESTFSFSASPIDETVYVIKVQAETTSSSAQAECLVAVMGENPLEFYSYLPGESDWTTMGISAPPSTIEALISNNDFMIRLSNQQYYIFNNTLLAWEYSGITAPNSIKKSFHPVGTNILAWLQDDRILGYDPINNKWLDTTMTVLTGAIDVLMSHAILVLHNSFEVYNLYSSWTNTGVVAPNKATTLLKYNSQPYVYTSDNKLYKYVSDSDSWEIQSIVIPLSIRQIFTDADKFIVLR